MQVSYTDKPFLPEEHVAETIVRARKSWKTVKGKSEPVWPPHLEKALVQALLQYRPNDSRYARALGRFPKRNRFISDFIYEQTGVRRSPKQVGSRLQQLKDVNCGKQLLNHVANWSLGIQTDNIVVSTSMRSPRLDCNSSDSSPSPTSPLPRMSLDRPSVHNAEHTQFNTSTVPCNFPQTAPRIRKLSVYIHYNPHALPKKLTSSRPLHYFAGCLERPETIFSPEAQTASVDLADREPSIIFSSRKPIPAVSLTRVWAEQRMYSGEGRPMKMVEEYSQTLVCAQQPTTQSAAAGQSAGIVKVERASPQPLQEYFVYKTSLVDERMWTMLQQEGIGKYTLVQELICQIDSSFAQRNETFLAITYHFLPVSLNSPISGYSMGVPVTLSPPTSTGSISPTQDSPPLHQLPFPIASSSYDSVPRLQIAASGLPPTSGFEAMNMNMTLSNGATTAHCGAPSGETQACASQASLSTYPIPYDPGLHAQLNPNFRSVNNAGVNDLHLNPLLRFALEKQ